MAGKPRINIDYSTIYQSNSCGPFQIIENLGRDEKSRLFVKIRFIETGTEKVVRYDIAIAGKVIDDLYNKDFNKEYHSLYYGPFKIIEYKGRNHESKRIVRIKFINTGFENDVLLRFALNGHVKDYSINYQNISLDSSIDIRTYDDFIIDILQNRWNSMMQRCYNVNDKKYPEYGGLGVTVCDRWKIVDNYISDMMLVENFIYFYNNPQKYQLDKDYLQMHIPKNQRIYGPGRCIFLSIYDNANLAIKETHINGELYGVKELDSGNYQVTFSVDGSKISLGVYSNKIAAANAYNYYYTHYSKAQLVQLLNENIEYMSFDETQKYLIKSVNIK